MPINQEIYEKAADQVKLLELQMLQSVDLIDTMKDLGMDTTEAIQRQQAQQKTIDNWKAILTRKGFLD